MKVLLLATLAIAAVIAAPVKRDPWRAVGEQVLPHILTERANFLIKGAEAELQRHFTEGRRHLTQAFEAEIESLRILVRELEALDQAKHLELHHLHEVEFRLFHHENRLAEEGVFIANAHDEEEHRKNAEHHQNEERERVFPHILAERARKIIDGAEVEFKKHETAGLKHLTIEMERQIHAVKELEKELLGLDKERHLELHKLHEYESRLLHVENRLAEEELFVALRHDEEQHKRDGHHEGGY